MVNKLDKLVAVTSVLDKLEGNNEIFDAMDEASNQTLH